MKQIIAFAGAALFSLFLWRCTNDDINLPEGKPVEVSPQIAARTTDFAFEFFKKVQATQPANENVFVSPLSLHMALGMLLNGAEGETAQQISKALKTEGVDQAELNQAYQALLEGLPGPIPTLSWVWPTRSGTGTLSKSKTIS